MRKNHVTPASELHPHPSNKATMGGTGAVVGAILGGPVAALIGGALGTAFGAAADAKEATSPPPAPNPPAVKPAAHRHPRASKQRIVRKPRRTRRKRLA